MIFPVQELSPKRIQSIKDALKLRLLEKATDGWKKPVGDYVLREVIPGDSTVTDVYDLEPKTAGTAGIPEWCFDQADTVDDDLSSVLKAGEVVDDDAYIGFYGFVDYAGEAGELTGAADTPVQMGAGVSAEFIRGSSVLDFWNLGHLYAYDEVVGITDRPIIYTEKEKIDIKVCLSEATEDKYAGFMAYVCEPYGRYISPNYKPELRTMGVNSLVQLPIDVQRQIVTRSGVDPVQQLSHEQIARLYDRVKTTLFQMVVDEGYAKDLRSAKESYVIREFQAGDDSDDTDFVDIDQATAVTTGEEEWIQSASSLTAGDLKNVITTGQKIADKKFAALLGFADTTSASCLLEIAPADAAGYLDLWHVAHCYGYHDMVKGYTMRPTYYKENSPFVLKMCVRVAKQHRVKPIMLIAEEWGHVVSRT